MMMTEIRIILIATLLIRKPVIYLSKLQQRDYYYGAALSLFFSRNADSKPSLIESSDKACIYRMSTDTSHDFFIYMKYTSKEISSAKDERVWQFSLTETDKKKITDCINSNLRTYILLICGSNKLNAGEIAVLTDDEFKTISYKTGIRIKLQGKSPKKFTVIDRYSGDDLLIDRNRLNSKITNI